MEVRRASLKQLSRRGWDQPLELQARQAGFAEGAG
jgi:hypothetical protein